MTSDSGNNRGEKFYSELAEAIIDTFGNVFPTDFSDSYKRDSIIEVTPVWKSKGLTSAHVAVALKAQLRASFTSNQSSPDDVSRLTDAVMKIADMHKEKMIENDPLPKLSFDISERMGEKGLTGLCTDLIPTSEALGKLEKAARREHRKGNKYPGSAEGESLTVNRPHWSRTPKSTGVGDSFGETVKNAESVNRSQESKDRVGYLSYGNFLGHLLDWGVKMILLGTFTTVDLLSYVGILTIISEQHGGVRTVFNYDFVNRQLMSKAAQQGLSDLSKYMCEIDYDRVRRAKMDAEKEVASGSLANKSLKSPAKGWDSAKGPRRRSNITDDDIYGTDKKYQKMENGKKTDAFNQKGRGRWNSRM